jgi:oxygen-dependent protoporphyrinogen oxidase
LSARAVAGSRPKGKREFIAPPDGMGQFIERLHAALVRRDVSFRFCLTMSPDALEAGRPTVVATSANAAAKLLALHAPAFAAAAARVVVAPMSPVTAFFTPREQDLHGFGVLFPRGVGISALGVRFNGDIFAGRGPLRSETWIYSGAGSDVPTLTHMLRVDRTRVFGDDREPVALHPTIWPQAIPVYSDAVLATAAAQATLPPWLAVAGNYLGRIGVTGLVDVAAELAERIVRR